MVPEGCKLWRSRSTHAKTLPITYKANIVGVNIKEHDQSLGATGKALLKMPFLTEIDLTGM